MHGNVCLCIGNFHAHPRFSTRLYSWDFSMISKEELRGCKPHKHKFQARYDQEPPQILDRFKGSPSAFCQMIKALTRKIYVKDICIKCGEEKHRKPNEDR